jgi:hypothetical protein
MRVEAGEVWHRSTRPTDSGEQVEVARFADGTVGVRDSRDRTGPFLRFTPAEWHAFVEGAKDGEFDI